MVIWLVIMLIVIGWGVFNLLPGENTRQIEVETLKPTLIVDGKPIRVAVMADIHDDIDQLKIMLGKAKSNGVEMVFVAGDLTNEGKIGELKLVKDVLDKSGLEYAVVPGNHEYYLDNFKSIFENNYQSVRIGEIKFILVDNSFWRGMDDVQKKWIEDAVVECRVLLCVGIMHKPLNNTFSLHVMGENNKKAAAEAVWLRELLISSGVKQIEVGHLHYASSYELEGLRTDIVGAISKKRNNQSPRYTELVISKELIERKVVEDANDIGN